MKAHEYYSELERKYDGPIPKVKMNHYRKMLQEEAQQKIASNKQGGTWKEFILHGEGK